MSYVIVVLLLCLTIATLTAALVAAAAGVLARIDGSTLATALARAGVAFGGALTLALLIISVNR
jgi:hypothetical protein